MQGGIGEGKSLKTAAAENWYKFAFGKEYLQDDTGINLNEYVDDEYEEWHGIQVSEEMDEIDTEKRMSEEEKYEGEQDEANESEMGDSSDWETEDYSNDRNFEDESVDVADEEVLYNQQGNIIEAEELGTGLREIMQTHMHTLQKKLSIFQKLASIENI